MPILMLEQVQSLPDLLSTAFDGLDAAVHAALDEELCRSVQRVYVTGCGNSHHAALSSELAIETLSGVPDEPLTALQFARYASTTLPQSGPNTNLVIGISVSGSVARTTEALAMARLAGATTAALTATPGSRVAEQGDRIILSTSVDLPGQAGIPVPGIRSFFTNLLALLLVGVRLGEVRGRLSSQAARDVRRQMRGLADAVAEAISMADAPARRLAEDLKAGGLAAADGSKALELHFLGAGPNYGTALFSAAKVLEASGDPALAQDMEEWAHLQFFNRQADTPTFLISAGERDLSRAVEIATAAKTLGRKVIAVTQRHAGVLVDKADYFLEIPRLPEMFSPLVAAIPGELFAAYRAETIGEAYFRGFGGGRSQEGGGGISRIRTSEVWEELPQ